MWINRIASTEPMATRAAAKDLLKALTYSESKFTESYGTAIPPGLVARLAKARWRLSQIAAE